MGRQVVIIGAGPAGLLAAIASAGSGASVIVLEKMKSPGRKLLITGSGRCNVSNTADLHSFIGKYFNQGKFLYPAFQNFFRPELISLLQKQNGHLQFITENDGKLFPASGLASDVLAALLDGAKRLGVRIETEEAAEEILVSSGHVSGVRTRKRNWSADSVILAAGGCSYPGTGSTGDSYSLAAAVGHKIAPVRPALVPLVIKHKWLNDLKGISLPIVKAELLANGRRKARDRGDLLITHFGLSGPVILRLSRYLADQDGSGGLTDSWQIKIDLLPELNNQRLIEIWQKQIANTPRQHINNALAGTLPARLMPALITAAGFDPEISAGIVSPHQLEKLARAIKGLVLPIDQTRGFREAMVTAGGVSLKEIDPGSMESKIIKDLYIAGEALDIDGDTGGYNLQAAFSTGWLAGKSAAGLN